MEPTASHNKTITIVSLLIMVAAIVFGVTVYYSYFSDSEVVVTPEEEEEFGFVPDVVDVRHQFKDGAHIFVGEVAMPTPCDLLETDSIVQVREPKSDLLTLQFNVINEAEACAQVITPARFKLTAGAGEDAEVVATWNGKAVRLNLIEVGPEEDIDSFEVYIKG